MNLHSHENHANDAESGKGPPQIPERFLLTLGVLLAALFWTYWETAAYLVKAWSDRPVYSHGFFVVPFAVWLMWRHAQESNWSIGKPHAAGLWLLASAFGLRWFGTNYFYNYLTMVSLIPAIAGILIIAGGLAVCRWSWPAVLMLGFMIPLPYQLETALQGPLRRVGTGATVYFMQSVGLNVVAEGNVIILDHIHIGVEEACSGLSMLLTFVFLSTAVVFVSRRSAWESLAVITSAVPIALFSNVIRITVIGVLHKFHEPQIAELVHEYAAFLMMPTALGMLWIETAILSRLLIEEVHKPVGLIWEFPAAAQEQGQDGGDRNHPLASPTPCGTTVPPLRAKRTNRGKRRKSAFLDIVPEEAREEPKLWHTNTMIAPR